jgi:hypothetical protein
MSTSHKRLFDLGNFSNGFHSTFLQKKMSTGRSDLILPTIVKRELTYTAYVHGRSIRPLKTLSLNTDNDANLITRCIDIGSKTRFSIITQLQENRTDETETACQILQGMNIDIDRVLHYVESSLSSPASSKLKTKAPKRCN